MAKSSRLVILLEPAMTKQLKQWSARHHQPVSAVVRRSITYYLNVQDAQARMGHAQALKALQIPLKGLENPTRLEQALQESYHRA